MKKKYNLSSKYQGFTIVEILVVVVIIGILIGLVTVAYSGIQKSAQTAQTKQDLDDIYKALSIYRARNGIYPTTLTEAGITQNAQGTSYQYTPSTVGGVSTYCLTGTNGTVSYKLESGSNKVVEGGCTGHVVGGSGSVTNLATNPSIETATTNIGGANATVARSSTWASHGNYSLAVTPSAASVDSWAYLGGDGGAIRLNMQAGNTYTIKAVQHLPAALTGTLDSRAAKIVFYQRVGGSYSSVNTGGTNAPGTRTLTLTFTINAAATEAFIRLYNGGSTGAGTIYYDSIMITEGSTSYNYADGSSSNWTWNGAANTSSSKGPTP